MSCWGFFPCTLVEQCIPQLTTRQDCELFWAGRGGRMLCFDTRTNCNLASFNEIGACNNFAAPDRTRFLGAPCCGEESGCRRTAGVPGSNLCPDGRPQTFSWTRPSRCRAMNGSYAGELGTSVYCTGVAVPQPSPRTNAPYWQDCENRWCINTPFCDDNPCERRACCVQEEYTLYGPVSGLLSGPCDPARQQEVIAGPVVGYYCRQRRGTLCTVQAIIDGFEGSGNTDQCSASRVCRLLGEDLVECRTFSVSVPGPFDCECAICGPVGACCRCGQCSRTTEAMCTERGGNYQGDGTVCVGQCDASCDGPCLADDWETVLDDSGRAEPLSRFPVPLRWGPGGRPRCQWEYGDVVVDDTGHAAAHVCNDCSIIHLFDAECPAYLDDDGRAVYQCSYHRAESC